MDRKEGRGLSVAFIGSVRGRLARSVVLASGFVLAATLAAALPVGPPVTPMGAGTEHRDWVTRPQTLPESPPSYAITEQDNVMVAMRDGINLSTTLFLPNLGPNAPAPPCVLEADGYGAALDSFFIPQLQDLAKRGYAVVFAKLRGTPPSQGVTGLYNHYGQDGYDLVEWMATQPWCNGNVGMVGGSLLGISQLLTAKEAPPHLMVIMPDDGNSDTYWYLWWVGGMLPGPGRIARQFVPGAENEYPLAIAHPTYDSFWRDRTTIQEDIEALARRGLPVLTDTGWDSYMAGSAKVYQWLRDGGAGNRTKIFIGPWAHGGSRVGQLPISSSDYQVLWLDRWLKGVHNGVDTQPRALLYVQGPNQWRFESDWPIRDEHRTRLYLSPKVSGTAASLNDGSLNDEKPLPQASSVSYHYSPQGPYNAVAVDLSNGRPTFDKSPYEAHALTWTSEPLTVPTEMTGYPHFTFWAAATATDTDFVVEITDVSAPDASGHSVSLQVTRGYLNGPHYFSRSNPHPLVPGTPYQFKMELFPTSYVFAAGHRIRVVLQGAAIDPTLNIGWQGPGLNPSPATVTVFQDATHPSQIELPIIGTGWRSLVTEGSETDDSEE